MIASLREKLDIIARYRQRVKECEAALADGLMQFQAMAAATDELKRGFDEKIEIASRHLAELEAEFAKQTRLVNIVQDGRSLRFTFVRNNAPYIISAIGTWDDDVAQWKRDLIE